MQTFLNSLHIFRHLILRFFFVIPAGRSNRNERVNHPSAGRRPEEAVAHDARGRRQVPPRRLSGRALAHHPPARAAQDLR